MNSTTNTLQASVINYCSTIGRDPLLVQGAGGNVSWKEGNTLWIKASGTWLADADEKNIFVPVDFPHLRAAIEREDFTVTPKIIRESVLRPSIETLLHALMPHRVVVHLHAIEILAHLVRENCQSDLQLLVEKSIKWSMVQYYKPGVDLAFAVNDAITQKPNVNVIFLKNHGVVIGGDDIKEIQSLLKRLISTLSTPFDSNIFDPKEITPIVVTSDQKYTPVNIPGIQNLVFYPHLFNRLKINWALYPDHVVFLGSHSFCYETIESLIKDVTMEKLPDVIFLKGRGVFAKPDLGVAIRAQLKCYYDVLIRQTKDTRLTVLNEQQIASLLNWDAEQYRKVNAK
jgi:rhamnose utilization protein RhaD (predicted bifunctional aldolase and dehydrogenase)